MYVEDATVQRKYGADVKLSLFVRSSHIYIYIHTYVRQFFYSIHLSYFKTTFIIFLLSHKDIDHLSCWSLIEICDTITIRRKKMIKENMKYNLFSQLIHTFMYNREANERKENRLVTTSGTILFFTFLFLLCV